MDSSLEHSRSLSQPVTPKRSSSPSSTPDRSHSHSLPNSALRRAPFFNIHLPSQELFQQETSEILSQQVHYEKGRSRTKPSTPTNRASLTPRRATSLTPIIRSGSLTPRSRTSLTPMQSGRSSRRRSSIIVTKEGEKVYRPEYQGPITLDYLRFFCKASIQSEEMVRTKRQELDNPFIDKNSSMPGVEVEEEEEDTVEDIQIDKQVEEDAPSSDNFNDSLQIPDAYEKLLASPAREDTQIEKLQGETPENSHVSREVEKPKPLSYLQKILLSKKKQSSFLSSVETVDQDTSVIARDEVRLKEESVSQISVAESATNNDRPIHQFTIQSDSQIDNKLFPSWTKSETELKQEEASHVADTVDAQSVKLKTESITDDTPGVEDIKGEPEVETKEEQATEENIDWDIPDFDAEIPGNDEIPEDVEVDNDESTHTPDSPVPALPNETDESDVTPEDRPEAEEDVSRQTPDLATPANEQRTPETSSLFIGDDSGSGHDEIIQEEFVLDDDPNESIFDGIAEAHMPEEEDSQTAKAPLERMIPRKRPSPSEPSGLDVNFRDVSYIVRSIQAQNFLEADMPPRKKTKKPKAFSKDIVSSIQDKSNEFLDHLMDDLKSYARHRGSSIVDMNDVLLYLQRTKFTGKRSTSSQEIDQISVLAQRFLPLEDLIALDNDLYDPVSSNK